MGLKLFVWDGVLTDYSSGIMFALAHDVDEARRLIVKACDYVIEEDLAKEPTVYTTPVARVLWGGS